jgi:hypothetical protein
MGCTEASAGTVDFNLANTFYDLLQRGTLLSGNFAGEVLPRKRMPWYGL